MADQKISELNSLSVPDNSDVFAIVDDSVSETKKISWSDILSAIGDFFSSVFEPALGFTPEDVANKATDFSVLNDTLYPSVSAVNNAINSAVIGLLDYRGTYNASSNLFPSTGGSGVIGAILKGDFWVCSVAGTLGSKSVSPGDLIICLVDTPGQTGGNWDLVEHDLGYAPEDVANKKTDLSGNSDTFYPSQKAVKTAVDAKQNSLGFTAENVANKDTDSTFGSNSDTKYPSQKAVKTALALKQDSIVLRGYIDGIILSNAADSDHDITFGIGAVTLSSGLLVSFASALTKQIDATWAAGTNHGGLFSGTVSNATWYHCFIIRKDSDGSLDAGFDTSLTASNIPSGYTAYRRVGSILTNASANIIQFIQRGDEFRWYSTDRQDSTPTLTTTATAFTLSVPPIAGIVAKIIFSMSKTASRAVRVWSPLLVDRTPAGLLTSDLPVGLLFLGSSGEGDTRMDLAILTDNGTVMASVNTSTIAAVIDTYGWTDGRGKNV